MIDKREVEREFGILHDDKPKEGSSEKEILEWANNIIETTGEKISLIGREAPEITMKRKLHTSLFAKIYINFIEFYKRDEKVIPLKRIRNYYDLSYTLANYHLSILEKLGMITRVYTSKDGTVEDYKPGAICQLILRDKLVLEAPKYLPIAAQTLRGQKQPGELG